MDKVKVRLTIWGIWMAGCLWFILARPENCSIVIGLLAFSPLLKGRRSTKRRLDVGWKWWAGVMLWSGLAWAYGSGARTHGVKGFDESQLFMLVYWPWRH